MGKGAGVKTILTDFSGWTSAHGIPHIGSAQGWTLRIFWTLITIGLVLVNLTPNPIVIIQ